jgi:hypothetical protein
LARSQQLPFVAVDGLLLLLLVKKKKQKKGLVKSGV